jgi:hypothetical protein
MRAANVDTVQAEIVKSLRQIGASVQVTSGVGKGFPDLVVGWRGQTFLIECKTGNDKLNQMQQDWHAAWAGHVAVVRTPEEAQLAVIDAKVGGLSLWKKGERE